MIKHRPALLTALAFVAVAAVIGWAITVPTDDQSPTPEAQTPAQIQAVDANADAGSPQSPAQAGQARAPEGQTPLFEVHKEQALGQEGRMRLLVLGDSLSSAYGLEVELGWVALIEKRLREQNTDAQMINASIAGETTRGGLYRLPALLRKHDPDLVIIELGANDGLRGLSLKKLSANLDEIISLCAAHPSKVIVAAIPVTSNYGSFVLQKMREIYLGVGRKHAVTVIDFFDRDFVHDPQAYQKDRLHPNAATHKLIADVFWPEISKIISAPPKNSPADQSNAPALKPRQAPPAR